MTEPRGYVVMAHLPDDRPQDPASFTALFTTEQDANTVRTVLDRLGYAVRMEQVALCTDVASVVADLNERFEE